MFHIIREPGCWPKQYKIVQKIAILFLKKIEKDFTHYSELGYKRQAQDVSLSHLGSSQTSSLCVCAFVLSLLESEDANSGL